MRTDVIKTKDGNEVKKNKLEVGDKVIAQYQKVFVSEERLGVNKTTNQPFKTQDFILGVKVEGSDEELKVWLTKTQADRLQSKGDLLGKTIEAYEYENKFGKQVGIKVVE